MTESTTKEEKMGSAFDLLGKSAQIVKNNWLAFALVNILAILGAVGDAFGNPDKADKEWASRVSGQLSGLSGGELASAMGLGFGVVLLFAIVATFLLAMATSLEVKSAAGKKPDMSELFDDGKKYFFRIIGLLILIVLIVISGLILLIIPGIIAIGRLAMSPYHLVDKNIGVVEALKRSNSQAIGKMGLIYGAIGVTIVVAIFAGIVGVIPVLGPLLGAAITIAYSLVLALRYQQLKSA